jgi:hypothetical protein
MAIKSYLSPNGSRILGTSELLYARADIIGIDEETGEPEFDGHTEVFWDTQSTQTKKDGHTVRILYLCEDGEEWTFDQLVPDDAEDK